MDKYFLLQIEKLMILKILEMRKFLLLLFLCSSSVVFAQTKITGTITDADAGTPLPGANVMISGSSVGTTTDFDGDFLLETDADSGEIIVSYIGFTKNRISFNGSEDLGTIVLTADQNSLSEIIVVGRGVIDLEDDRRTPNAVSTITRQEIQQRATGNVEFPQVLKNTPNVYVTGESGGFGDSKMFVRGFDQSNTAFLLNGQPINGMEDGNMYWSNWAVLPILLMQYRYSVA